MTGRFFITTAVVLFLSATIINARPGGINSLCPRPCGNECEFLVRPGRSCKAVNGIFTLTCDPGFESPRDGPKEICLPVSWKCRTVKRNETESIECENYKSNK